MLTRARQRLQPAARGEVTCLQGDVRQAAFEEQAYDIILAAAVFHHLRGEQEWRAVFAKCYKALRPGGWLWIYDMIEHDTPAVQSLMQARYGEYLADQKDEAYRDQVFAIIEREDSPRALLWQIHLLKETGFSQVEILHKNSLFAAFGAKRESG